MDAIGKKVEFTTSDKGRRFASIQVQLEDGDLTNCPVKYERKLAEAISEITIAQVAAKQAEFDKDPLIGKTVRVIEVIDPAAVEVSQPQPAEITPDNETDQLSFNEGFFNARTKQTTRPMYLLVEHYTIGGTERSCFCGLANRPENLHEGDEHTTRSGARNSRRTRKNGKRPKPSRNTSAATNAATRGTTENRSPGST